MINYWKKDYATMDEQNAKWWFSVLDIVAVLTDQNDYTKTRNYIKLKLNV
ncbi:MAG: hypothetical protein OEW75_11455 [Cyclobacteriaceae bacterium]|nr:hypothetical protein [Cyclobacteriaceae bacterium]